MLILFIRRGCSNTFGYVVYVFHNFSLIFDFSGNVWDILKDVCILTCSYKQHNSVQIFQFAFGSYSASYVFVKAINKLCFTIKTVHPFDCQGVVTWLISELPSGAAVIPRLHCEGTVSNCENWACCDEPKKKKKSFSCELISVSFCRQRRMKGQNHYCDCSTNKVHIMFLCIVYYWHHLFDVA